MSAETVPPHDLAQAALLLSFWTPPGQPTGSMPNTTWLIGAVHHARSHNAHIYGTHSDCTTDKTKRLWKRIWWGCIIRDRVMSIGLRRAPQITRSNFDFEKCEPLHWGDLYEEGETPKFFDTVAANALQQMLTRLIKLCVALTDFQVLSQVFQAPVFIGTEQCLKYLDEVRRIKVSLRSWYEETEATFLPLSSRSEAQYFECSALTSDATFLHLHLIYMYYQ